MSDLTFIQCERNGEKIEGAQPHYRMEIRPQQVETDKLKPVHLLGLIFLNVIGIMLYNLGA